MHPYIYIGGFELPVYGMLVFFSYIAGLFVCAPLGKKYGINGKYIICSGTFAAAGMLIGSKSLYLLTKLPDFIKNYENIYTDYSPIDKIEFLLGGYVFYGGLLGAIAGVLVFCRSFSFDKGSLLAALTPMIPFAHCFGRIGCFFGGCCYGVEYHGFMAVYFPHNPISPNLDAFPRFPVQLIEAFLNLVLFAFLYWYTRRKSPSGIQTLGIYLVCYSIIRFMLEFLRGDIVRGVLAGLSTSQWISLILFPLGLFMILNSKKKKLPQ